MCGFLAHYGLNQDISSIQASASKIRYRGPDNTQNIRVNEKLFMSFHRLAIIDPSAGSNQPLVHPKDSNLTLVCNGEIYNYKELIDQYNLQVQSGSDCEVILHLYKIYGISETVSKLDGVFAFALYDANIDRLFIARDPYGVRPAFIGWSEDDSVAVASEMKALTDLCDKSIIPFPPGSWWGSDVPGAFMNYHTRNLLIEKNDEETMCDNIRKLLTTAVSKRMMADREVGCLLSGGLDSSLISALVASMSKDSTKLKTFSIGMKGSPDLQYAQLVAEHIKSDHHSVQLTEQDFLDAIETVIYNIESFDTTTVRASVGNYLISKYIREHTDVKVVFNGDGADEVCMGYVYNRNAPSLEEFRNENIKLLQEIHLFDVLRSDRSISSNGLEARTPFLDLDFVNYYLSIPTAFKMFGSNGRSEKYMLRKAFEKTGLLPDEVLHRHKCAFSDGVSSIENSWHKTLKDFIDSQISDEEFESEKNNISHCTPVLKESYFYRKVFNKLFGKQAYVIPHFWMPRWTNTQDPSARELENYKE
jgi:asparagine synthase (glutamine-hydrolysing)